MDYYKIKDKLCKKLQELSLIENPSMTDIDKMHIITDTIKNIGKIEMQDGGYSQRSYNPMVYGNDYGNSYANRGQHYVRGHYSRGMNDEMENMMNDPALSSADREVIRKAMALMR